MDTVRVRLTATLCITFAVGLTATGQSGKPPRSAVRTAARSAMKSIGSVREIMEAITSPASDAVFNAASEPPQDEKSWTAVRRQALALAESGNLLMMADRAPDAKDWMAFSLAQRDAAVVAMKAAAARDVEALSASSDALYETCASCHQKYFIQKQ